VAKAIFLLCTHQNHGVFHVASSDYLNRVQLAEKVLSFFPDHKIEIKSLTTAELGQPAPRPLQGGLKALKFKNLYPDFQPLTIDESMRGEVQAKAVWL
jgi:dTDP-4-dehydrorhamnose reductase